MVGGAAVFPGEQHCGVCDLLVEGWLGVDKRTFPRPDLREVEIKQIA
jgi:hypothetical protein